MDTTRLKDYFTGLQSRIVKELEAFDGQSFRTDAWDRPEGGGGKSRLIEEGHFFERGGGCGGQGFAGDMREIDTAALEEMAFLDQPRQAAAAFRAIP